MSLQEPSSSPSALRTMLLATAYAVGSAILPSTLSAQSQQERLDAARAQIDAMKAQLANRGSSANSQTQSTVTVDNKDYTVTEMAGGRMLTLSGPEGTAMVGVSNGKITSYINPQGGIYNGTDMKPLIGKVFAAYEEKKSETTVVATNNPAPTPVTPTAAPPRVEFPAGGGAIVHNTAFGDITLNSDGTQAKGPTQVITNPLTQEKITKQLVAEYRGGDSGGSAGSTAGHFFGGVGRAVLQSGNTHVVSRIDTRGSNEWVTSQIEGGKKTDVFGSGDKEVASVYNPRVQDGGVKSQARGFLQAVADAEKVASEEATARKNSGQTVAYDPNTPAGQNATKELARFTAQ